MATYPARAVPVPVPVPVHVSTLASNARRAKVAQAPPGLAENEKLSRNLPSARPIDRGIRAATCPVVLGTEVRRVAADSTRSGLRTDTRSALRAADRAGSVIATCCVPLPIRAYACATDGRGLESSQARPGFDATYRAAIATDARCLGSPLAPLDPSTDARLIESPMAPRLRRGACARSALSATDPAAVVVAKYPVWVSVSVFASDAWRIESSLASRGPGNDLACGLSSAPLIGEGL